jgi:hypothetical protein
MWKDTDGDPAVTRLPGATGLEFDEAGALLPLS